MRHITFATASSDDSNAIYKLMSHWRDNLTRHTGEIKHLKDIKSCDILVVDCPVHAYLLRRKGCICRNMVVLMHSFENVDMRKFQHQNMGSARPNLVIVTSGRDVVNIVREWGHKATFVPISINTNKFYHLPYPDEFTVGYIGANMAHKRFNMIDKAAQEAGVKVVGSIRRSHYAGDFTGKETDFYRQISCYISATLCEHAPFPTLEALLCGRPLIIDPIVSNPPELRSAVEVGAGVVAGDDDRVRAIINVRDNFDQYANYARKFVMRSTASDFEDALEGLA